MLVMILSSGLQLLPLLASALEFGSAAAPALTALLKMGSWLSTEEFSVKVKLLQLFCGLWSPLFFSFSIHLFYSSCLTRVIFFLYFAGTANYYQTICLQWPSDSSCSLATYWSIWRVIFCASCWWASMLLIVEWFLCLLDSCKC